MKLVTREEWKARAPRSVTRIPGPVQSVTLHYEGPQMGQFDHGLCASKVRGIQNFHMDGRGWSDIAYSALVCSHGWVFEGRWVGVRSAANGTDIGNSTSYAVCGLWGVGDPFTDLAKDAALEVREYLRAAGAGSLFHPHSFWKATACPGDPGRSWLAAGASDPFPPVPVTPPPADMTPTQTAVGFTLYEDGSSYTFAEDGGVFADGCPFYGGLGGVRLNAPVVWGQALADKSGYYMVGADGGVFAFGGARPIAPYKGLFAEYARGERRVKSVQVFKQGLALMTNDGNRYVLGV